MITLPVNQRVHFAYFTLHHGDTGGEHCNSNQSELKINSCRYPYLGNMNENDGQTLFISRNTNIYQSLLNCK